MEKLHSLIADFSYLDAFSDSSLYLVRKDGLIFYSLENDQKNEKETQSIGVLLGGAWQAASALADLVGKDEKAKKIDSQPLRLSFDSSSKGLFILPLSLGGEDYFISIIFQETVNPAPLRNKLRLLRNYLKDSEDKLTLQKAAPSPEREGYLFENITDDEMDNLFSSHGN